VFTKEGFIKN